MFTIASQRIAEAARQRQDRHHIPRGLHCPQTPVSCYEVFGPQAEFGTPVVDLRHQTGISEQTFYRWQKQYAGLQSGQARKLKQFQDESSRLKKLVAALSLDKAILQDLNQKKWPGTHQPCPSGSPVSPNAPRRRSQNKQACDGGADAADKEHPSVPRAAAPWPRPPAPPMQAPPRRRASGRGEANMDSRLS
jgi:putative transposase